MSISTVAVQQLVLPSKLQLVTQHVPTREIVVVNIRVAAGSMFESSEKSGLAHLAEHAVFQGTHQFPGAAEFARAIESYGAQVSAFTHVEYSSYWLKSPKRYFETVFPIFMEMFARPQLDGAAINREKDVLHSELLEPKDEFTQAMQLCDQAMWGTHPLGRPNWGTLEGIAALTPDDVRGFVQRNYTPSRTVMSVVGEIDPDQVASQVSQQWVAANPLPCEWSIEAAPPPSGDHWRFDGDDAADDETLVHLVFGLRMPPLGHVDDAAITLLTTLLGDGMSSLLYTRLRSERALCYSIETLREYFTHESALYIYAVTERDNLPEVLGEVKQTLRDVAQGRGIVDCFDPYKAQCTGQILLEADHLEAHAKALALSRFLTGSAESIQMRVDRLDVLDPQSLIDACDRWLTPENLFVGVIGVSSAETQMQCRSILNNE